MIRLVQLWTPVLVGSLACSCSSDGFSDQEDWGSWLGLALAALRPTLVANLPHRIRGLEVAGALEVRAGFLDRESE